MRKKEIIKKLGNIEDKLDVIISADRIREILEDQIRSLIKEKQNALDRLMARDFESYKTYTAEGQQEEVGEEIKPEEDADNAGEILEVTD